MFLALSMCPHPFWSRPTEHWVSLSWPGQKSLKTDQHDFYLIFYSMLCLVLWTKIITKPDPYGLKGTKHKVFVDMETRLEHTINLIKGEKQITGDEKVCVSILPKTTLLKHEILESIWRWWKPVRERYIDLIIVKSNYIELSPLRWKTAQKHLTDDHQWECYKQIPIFLILSSASFEVTLRLQPMLLSSSALPTTTYLSLFTNKFKINGRWLRNRIRKLCLFETGRENRFLQMEDWARTW